MRLDEMQVEEVTTVEGEVVEEESEEGYEADSESDLNTALELLERCILLNDDLIDDRLKSKNKISYRTGKRITDLTNEIWNFMQQVGEYDTGPVSCVDIGQEMKG